MGDKVALITGASRGIGTACAKALSEAGYRIAVHYRGNEELAAKLTETLPDSKMFKADVSNEKECTELIKAVKSEMGRIEF